MGHQRTGLQSDLSNLVSASVVLGLKWAEDASYCDLDLWCFIFSRLGAFDLFQLHR